MNHRIVVRGVLALAVSLLLSAAAHAQSFRTYLSSSGTANPSCSLASPCRLLPDALAAVADGGEVWMLDSANYNTGPVNIIKSVTILAVPGALGSVVALGGNAININTASVKVALRNLVIVPYVGGGGTSGVFMTAGTSLTVEKCLIAGLPNDGVAVSASGATVLVIDSMIRGNGGHAVWVQDGAHAIVSRTTMSGNGAAVYAYGVLAGPTTADINDSTIDGNVYGAMSWSTNASAVVKVSVRNSQIVRNATVGLFALSDAGGLASLSASDNVVSNNGTGIKALSAGARVWASGNTLSENGMGFANGGGLFESTGDNDVRLTDTTGPITTIPKM